MTSRAALDAMLTDLGRHLAFPPAPPLVEAVADRLAGTPAGGRPSPVRRWALVAAAAALVVAVALPAGRQAVAGLLGIGSVGVSPVSELTPATTLGALGRLTTLDAAAEAVGFEVLTVEGAEPDAVFVDTTVPGGMVTLAYGSPTDGWVLLVTQLTGSVEQELATKEVGPGTVVRAVTVDGAPGLWIEGAPHTVYLRDATGNPRPDSARLVGNTLLTTRHGVTVRLEADATAAEVAAVAERLEPAGP